MIFKINQNKLKDTHSNANAVAPLPKAESKQNPPLWQKCQPQPLKGSVKPSKGAEVRTEEKVYILQKGPTASLTSDETSQKRGYSFISTFREQKGIR